MTRITIPDPLASQFQELSVPAALFDAAGNCLGHFVPQRESVDDHCPHSSEEIERLRREPGGRTLPEIWKSLGVS